MKIKKELTVTLNSGDEVTIYILDIIESEEFHKDYVLYLINLDEENIYASSVEEKDGKFELNAITEEKEMNFVQSKIEEMKSQLKSEGDE